MRQSVLRLAVQQARRLGDRARHAASHFVADPDNTRPVRLAITQLIRPGASTIDWQQRNSAFFTAILVERNVMFLILTLIIVVAAFNIISIMIMMVKDKGRDIAILRTMGATQGMILRIFMLSGASIGIIGTFAGFALGLGFAANIDITTWTGAVGLGLATWVGFPVVLLTGSIQWENVSWRLATIHAGDWLVKLTLVSCIVGLWR